MPITTKNSRKKTTLVTKLSEITVVCNLCVLASGCMNVESVSNLKGVDRLPRPVQTYISDHLSCISDMIAEYRYALDDGSPQPIRIAIPYVKDRTNVSSRDYPESEIPNDMTDMALGIASRIGGPVRLVHVPDTNEILDAARVDSQPEKPKFFDGFEFSHYRPNTLILYGALTEYDRITAAREKTLDLDGEIGDGDWQTNIEYSKLNGQNQARMTMDFRVVHPAVGDVVNHASSTNTIELFMIARDRSYGLSVNGNSVGFAKAYTDVEARHQAIRMLIEMGIIESIAKFFFVPYWKCYPEVENTGPVEFTDYFDATQSLLFNPLTSSRKADTDLSDNKEKQAQTPEPSAQELEQSELGDNEAVADYRDSELINSLLFYFNHDEFLHNTTRYHVKREDDDSQFDISDNTISIEGKQNKLRKILALYRKNISDFKNSTDQAIYTRMYKHFLERQMITEQDTEIEQRMFVGLWLNAPVRTNARWKYL